MTEEERTRRGAENAKLKARIEELESEFRDRITKVEQKQTLQSALTANDNTPNNNSSNFNLVTSHHEKPLEDRETDDFLNEVHKKMISDDIRQRNKEKKLQCDQDNTSDTAYVPETVNNVEKSYEPEINEITNFSSSEPSHEIEVVATQSVIANTLQGEIPTVNSKVSHDIKPVNKFSYNSELSRDKKPVNIVNRFSKNSKLSHSSDEDGQTCVHQDDQPPSNIATEFVQGLLVELLSPDGQLQDIKFSPSRTLIPGSISIKKLANSFCQANVARNKSITAKRSEITLWCLFSQRFEDKVVELRSNDKKLTDQTARKQIYNEMKAYLTDVSDPYLRVRTCKARKINKLFGYEYDPVTLKKIDGIPGYMVNRITCSADSISRLTNPQIDYIIEQVNSKTTPSNNNKNVAPASIPPDVYFEESEEETNVASAPIPSAHVSNSSDNSNEESWFDADAFFNEPNPAKVNTDTSDFIDYFPETQSEKGSNTDDENSSNDSDSDVYFKSDDSDSDDEYDHELHERLQREEMARLAKLEEKTPTKPADEEDDFDKMLSEAIEEELANFDDPTPQLVTVNA
ncbi:hypothetical protein GLOIN_2v1806926 [Rhizophagus clarus]|uniref:Uncharacterized protein n=1 Tax=Rhizophagus clarus TaxID=94130 RepID=A0A8H3QYM4_9GLOM|nr:hypothetical protein GLOIN_2v1806926 [Rhizophagus clarus]